jgi:hypothetical protein
MDIREGGRRLVLTLAWIAAIGVWIAGFFFSVIIAKRDSDVYIAGWVITFIVGFAIKSICHNVGLWVVDGFVGDQKNNE